MRAVEKFFGLQNVPPGLLARLDRNFQALNSPEDLPPVIREVIDCTSASVTRYLVNIEKDYYFVKSDSSANVVSIQPSNSTALFSYSGGTYTEIELAGQGAFVWVTYFGGVWYLVSYGG